MERNLELCTTASTCLCDKTYIAILLFLVAIIKSFQTFYWLQEKKASVSESVRLPIYYDHERPHHYDYRLTVKF
jgi:hypothetical protein